MPIQYYYGGRGRSVMNKMKKRYGKKKAERVFYATFHKQKRKRRSKK